MEQEQMIQAVTAMAQAMAKPTRTPVYRRPDEYGMAYEDIFFNAIDGTRLEGWFIPAESELGPCDTPKNAQKLAT